MNKRVTIHIGLPKTATTTLQVYLRDSHDKLQDIGVIYPGRKEHEAHIWKRHRIFAAAISGRVGLLAPSFDLDACRNIVDETFEKFHRSDYQNLLWSHEGLLLVSHMWNVEYLEQLARGASVRLVAFLRYTDAWVESRIGQMIWSHAGPAKPVSQSRPMRPVDLSPPSAESPANGAPSGGFLGQGQEVIAAMRLLRERVPQAEVVVRSFDESARRGTVVSDALSAIGVPLEGDFANADREARSRNTTIPTCWTMLLYQLGRAEAETELVHEIALAATRRRMRSIAFAPMAGRRFRFLGDAQIAQLRADYDQLRQDYPDLPNQTAMPARPSERRLTVEDAVSLLEWLRPNISDETCSRACALIAASQDRIDEPFAS